MASPWDAFPDAPEEKSSTQGWDQFPDDQPIEAKEVTNLPIPRPNMFGSMDDETAQKVYDSYSRHPNASVDEGGNVLYRGTVVPKPEGNSGVAGFVEDAGRAVGRVADFMNPLAPVRDWIGEKVGLGDISSERVGGAITGGLMNAGRNIAIGGLAAGQALQEAPGSPSWIANKLGMSNPERERERVQFSDSIIRGAEDTLPKFNPEGTAEAVISGGTEILTGLAIGNKAVASAKAAGIADSVIAKAVEKAPTVIKFLSTSLAKAAAGAAGMSATLDGNNDTLAVGPDALIGKSAQDMVPILKGLDGKSETEGGEIIEKRLNVLYDNMVTALPIEMLAGAGKAGWSVIYDKFIEPVKGAVSESAKEKIVVRDLMNNVARAVDAEPGSRQAQLWESKIVDILRDDKNSKLIFESSIPGVESRTIPLDTSTTIDRGLVGDLTDEASAVKKLFSERRKSVIEKGGENVKTVLAAEKPIRETEAFIQDNRAVLGGDKKIEEGARGLQEIGRSRVNVANADLEATQAELAAAKSSVPDFLSTGPGGTTIRDASGELGSRTRLDRNAATDKILDTVERGSKTMMDHKDRLYKDFGDTGIGVPDAESLDDALMGVGLGEANSPLPAAIQDMITSSEGNLGSLYTDVAPRLNEIMRAAERRGEELPPAVKELYDNITRVQPAVLKEQAGEFSRLATRTPEQQAVIDASNDLESAASFYKDYYRPMNREGAAKEITDFMSASDKTRGKENAANVVKNTIMSDQPYVIDRFVKTLSTPEYGGSPKLVLDWIKGDVGDKIRADLVDSGLEAIDAKKLTSYFKQYRQATRSLPGLTKELDTLQTSLMKNKNDVKALEALVESKAGTANQIKDEVYKRVLNDFFKGEGIPNPNGYESFKNLFKDTQATGSLQTGKLDSVINNATGKPEVQEAMQSAWLRFLNEEVFTSAPGATNNRALSAAKVNDLLKGENNILDIGKKLFMGERQPVVSFLEELLNPSLDVTVAKKGSSFKGAEDPASIRKAKEAVNRMVRFVYGPLSRKGTNVNTSASLILEFLSGDNKAARIGDEMMSGSDGFLAIYDKFANQGPTKENARLWFKWLVASGVAQDGDYNKFMEDLQKENQDKQTKDAFSK